MDIKEKQSLVIQKVNRDTELAKRLLDFIKNFSWLEVKEHTMRTIENWEFEAWETPFVAMVDDCIVGMVSVTGNISVDINFVRKRRISW